MLLVGFGLLSLFGSNRAELSGAGALGVLSLGAVAGYGWKDDGKVNNSDLKGNSVILFSFIYIRCKHF